MKRSPLVLAALGATTLAAAVAAAALLRPRLYAIHSEVMKTTFLAKAVFAGRTGSGANEVLRGALSSARRVEELMSRFRPDSDVSRLAAAPAGRPVKLDPWTLDVLALSRDLSRRSGGAFDVTVGPLVKLYKFTGRQEKLPPTEAEIAETAKRVGWRKLVLDEDSEAAMLKAAGMTIDLSAVAKGFAVDKALQFLRERGARSALVEIGGEVRAFGTKPDGSPWTVGLRHPRAATLMGMLEVTDAAVATSGDYQKHFKRGGRLASHIIDPRTGKPLVGGAVSVTVTAPDCALADGLATAISALGPREGLKLAASYRAEGLAVEAAIVEETDDGRLVPHLSPGLRGRLELDLGEPAAPAVQSPGEQPPSALPKARPKARAPSGVAGAPSVRE